MMKDPQCFVAPPHSYVGIDTGYVAPTERKVWGRQDRSFDIYDYIVSKALAVQEESAVIVEQAKAQEAAFRCAAHEYLNNYADYDAGWDGENANAIEQACLRNAARLIDCLPLNILQRAGIDSFFPTPNGTMTMEIGSSNQYFVIDVGNTKILYYYRFNKFIAGLNEAVPFSDEVFQKITELFSEFNEKSKSDK